MVTKKKMSQKKQATMDDVYPEVEVFMKSKYLEVKHDIELKTFTMEAFT
jgi:hypothetical protein